jgi:GTP-binding protein HflX
MQSAAERTLLVAVDLTSRGRGQGAAASRHALDAQESIEELAVLTESAGGVVVGRLLQQRPQFDAATLVGSGKVSEIKALVDAEQVDAVIFDQELSPTQLRNLERSLEIKVVDRTQLILDIFASRARSKEGQLQVELAQLSYLLPRLAGHGTEMSRLGGGIGTRGPGETKLETDRRRIARRIAKLKKDLERVRATRGVQRSQRQAVPLSTISLVGYTNAGKSTLFNRLTGASVLTDSRMFATLDPTVRQVRLPSGRRVLLSDTVGFIRNLPTTLVEAFRATLEEVTSATLLLHIVDISSPVAAEQSEHVMKVLEEIHAGKITQILVLNKADLLPEGGAQQNPQTLTHRILGETARQNAIETVITSGATGAGVSGLLERIDRLLLIDPVARLRFRLPAGAGQELNLLHERAAVVSQEFREGYCEVVADAPESIRQQLAQYVVN